MSSQTGLALGVPVRVWVLWGEVWSREGKVTKDPGAQTLNLEGLEQGVG